MRISNCATAPGATASSTPRRFSAHISRPSRLRNVRLKCFYRMAGMPVHIAHDGYSKSDLDQGRTPVKSLRMTGSIAVLEVEKIPVCSILQRADFSSVMRFQTIGVA